MFPLSPLPKFAALLISEFEIWLLIIAAICAAVGIRFFFDGFRLLRVKRLILNTPLSRIHSAAVGLVELNGTPIGPYTLTSPVTGEACYYYRVRAWQWLESGNKHSWHLILDENLYVPFFLEDSTGRVLIVPQSAELDVHRSFSDEVSSTLFNSPGLLPPNVRDFMVKRGLIPFEKVRIEEQIIPRSFPLFVFGTLGERPRSVSFSATPNIPSELRDMLPLNSATPATWSGTLRSPGGVLLNFLRGLSGTQVKVIRLNRSAGSPPGGLTADTIATLTNAGMPLSEALGLAVATRNMQKPQPSSDHSNFGDFDLHPSVAVSKGERGDPFVISRNSQRELVGELGWKSTARIWCGPVLAIAGIWYLLASFHIVP